MVGERMLAAALALVGAPFRLHGRNAETGVDCVGLALLGVREAGVAVPDPPPYRLRAGELPALGAWMRKAGFMTAEGRRAGDILLLRVGPMQPHLAVDALDGVIHAHAGLGRVVHMPLPPEWTEIARWRIAAPDRSD